MGKPKADWQRGWVHKEEPRRYGLPLLAPSVSDVPARDGYNRGGGGPGPDPPTSLVTNEVTMFGHKKIDLKPAVLGSPQPTYVHGGGGVMQQHT